jgi:hypothetical protein
VDIDSEIDLVLAQVLLDRSVPPVPPPQPAPSDAGA